MSNKATDDLRTFILRAVEKNRIIAKEYGNRASVADSYETKMRYFALAEGLLEANKNILEALIEKEKAE